MSEDEYGKERRFEQRFSSLSVYLPGWLQGYKRNSESALEILAFLKRILKSMKQYIQQF